MNWLVLIGIAVLLDTFRIFIDNYISDVYYKGREVAAQKMFSAYAKTIIGIVVLIISIHNFGFQFEPLTILLLILSGVFSSIAEIPYYIALGIENSTNLGIFIQLAPIFYLILGWLFLGETFSPLQLVAIAIILIAPILIIMTSRKRSRKVKLKAVFFAFLYVVIAVIGNLIFVKVNAGKLETSILIEEIAIVIFGVGITDLATMLVLPKWRKRYYNIKKSSKNKVLIPLGASLIVGVLKTFASRMAYIIAPAVALASAASDSVEPIVIFFMGLVLTLIWPKFGREKLDKKTVLVHLIATVIVVIGIVLMQM